MFGSFAAQLASVGMPPYKGRIPLALNFASGYVAPSARLHRGRDVHLGRHVFIDERVTVYQDWHGAGTVRLGDGVHVMRDTVVEVGAGGAVTIEAGTHIQARCHLTSYVAPLRIGRDVEIAPDCAFFTYNHGFAPGAPIAPQPLWSRGGIVVADGVWLGRGVTVLDGAHIEEGAVIGAGAVVAGRIPAGAIAAGVPARVVGWRDTSRSPEQGGDTMLARQTGRRTGT